MKTDKGSLEHTILLETKVKGYPTYQIKNILTFLILNNTIHLTPHYTSTDGLHLQFALKTTH